MRCRASRATSADAHWSNNRTTRFTLDCRLRAVAPDRRRVRLVREDSAGRTRPIHDGGRADESAVRRGHRALRRGTGNRPGDLREGATEGRRRASQGSSRATEHTTRNRIAMCSTAGAFLLNSPSAAPTMAVASGARRWVVRAHPGVAASVSSIGGALRASGVRARSLPDSWVRPGMLVLSETRQLVSQRALRKCKGCHLSGSARIRFHREGMPTEFQLCAAQSSSDGIKWRTD